MFYGFSWRGVCDRRVAVTVELSKTDRTAFLRSFMSQKRGNTINNILCTHSPIKSGHLHL